MNEERMQMVKKHIESLREVLRFYYPDSGAGKTISDETLLGALAEALTRIDELSERVQWLVEQVEAINVCDMATSDRVKAIECFVGGQHWLKK
jgi:hypothetical protein